MEAIDLFKIGDFIVYPMQGAGVIEAIEEKEVLGEKQQYYIIKMPFNNMQVMIPTSKMENSRIRLVTDLLTLENVLHIFKRDEMDSTLSMKERFKINTEKLRTGNIQKGAEVVRDLMIIHKKKALNMSEKHMLESAKKIFLGEMGLIRGISNIQATALLNKRMEEITC